MNQLTIILLLENAEASTPVKLLLSESATVLHLATNAAAVDGLVRELEGHVDVIVLPSADAEGLDVRQTLQTFVSDQILSAIPLAVISTGCSNSTQAELLEKSGADLVIVPPWQGKLVLAQLLALAKRKKSFDSHLSSIIGELSLRPALAQALSGTHDSLILTRPDGTLLQINAAARSLFRLPYPETDRDLAWLEQALAPVLANHQSGRFLRAEPALGIEIQSAFNFSFTRADEQSLSADVLVSTLIESGNQIYGYAIALKDLCEINELGRSLELTRRSRSLGLLMAASRAETSESSGSFSLQKITQPIDTSPNSCSLSEVVAEVLEYLDLIISPDLAIRSETSGDNRVAIKRGDLFQIIGHMILDAADTLGPGGEIGILTGALIPGEGIPLVVSSVGSPALQNSESDYTRRLLLGSAEEFPDLSAALGAAQGIAQKYRLNLEIKQASPLERKLRIRLPLGH